MNSSPELLAHNSPAGLAWVASGGRWTPARHLRLLSKRLQAAAAGEIDRLMVFMPPRHGKSELISKYTPAWLLGRYPDRKVMLASYEQTFAASWGRKARDVLEEVGPSVFGVTTSQASSRADWWEIEGHAGVMTAVGVGGALTGKGADLLIIDDPVKNAEDAASETMREKAWDWWVSTARTRLQAGGAAIIVMTRWNEDDLAGRLLEAERNELGDRWEVISLPLLAEGEDALGREEGEPLWPEVFDADWAERTRTAVGSYYFSALYQQRPAPEEGGILKRAWWRYWDGNHQTAPHFDSIVQSWDMAFKDTDGSDYVVGQVWGRFGADKYLIHQVRARMEFTESVQAVLDLTAWVEAHYPARKAHAKLVEDKANGPAVISQLRRRVPGLIAVDPQGDKVARARAVAPDVEAGNVFLPGAANADHSGPDPTLTPAWVQGLVNECASFPNAAYDDQVDALSQALMRLAGSSGNYRQKGGKVTRTGGMKTRGL